MTKYVLLDADAVVDIDFSEVKETSEDTLRYSLDGTKTFVKYDGDTPSFLEGYSSLTHAELKVELNNGDWDTMNAQDVELYDTNNL
tara:strand:- start:939 stop:1196 length:258 start_codon:yes stop_codon:yes gene_type:complete